MCGGDFGVSCGVSPAFFPASRQRSSLRVGGEAEVLVGREGWERSPSAGDWKRLRAGLERVAGWVLCPPPPPPPQA